MMTSLRFRLAALFLTLMIVMQGVGAQAWAQDAAPDYKTWGTFSLQAEETATTATTSDAALSTLRADVVKWRNEFVQAQSTNADQILTIKDQIAALGEPPAEGETEDEMIAKRRTELNEALAKAQAPGISASEAASRADGVIRNIDKVMRERQADKLLRLSPSAANPVNWPAAVSLFRWKGAWIYDETIWRFAQPMNYDTLRNNAPLIAILILVSGVLLLRGGRWMGALTLWLLTKTAMRGRNLISGIVSLGQVVLPVVGAVMMTTALGETALFGPIMMNFFGLLPQVLAIILGAWWLGGRIFPTRGGVESALNLAEEGRAEGRFHALLMGVALGLQMLLERWIMPQAVDYLGGSGDVSAEKAIEAASRADAAHSVLTVPLQIFAALVLFRMGQLLRRQIVLRRASEEEAEFRDSVLRTVGNAAIVIAVVAPLLGIVGYISAANALIWPAILTLGVFSIVAVLQDFLAEFYVSLSRTQEGRREGLIPVLAGFVLALAALPVLALIWGMRTEDLTDFWTSIITGFSMGGVRISPAIFLTFTAVFAVGYMATRALQGALKSTILPKTKLDKGGQNAIVSGIGYTGIFLAALFAISSAGIDLSSLAIVAGALSVGIGFGLQNIVSNFVSGIILLIERPISEGDWIEVGGQMGTVKSISVRSTRIETADRFEVIVPNADFVSGQVTNWTRGNKTGRGQVPVGVAYGTDTRRVEAILLEIARDHPLVSMSPEPQVLFMRFGADSLDFEVRIILADVGFRPKVISDLNHAIAARFAAEGIEIPFAQRDLWLRNPEVLMGKPKKPAAKPTTAATPAPPTVADVDALRLISDDNDDDGDADGPTDGYGGHGA
jgi:small-conductance mechanosensitive channel